MPALIVDPALIAAVTRQFQLRGSLRPFNLTENVVPIFDIGRLVGADPQEVVTPDLNAMVAAGHSTVTNPHYGAAAPDSRALNVDDDTTSPVATTVLADTGQLAAGLHHVQASITSDAAAAFNLVLQHRNAANAADIVLYRFNVSITSPIQFSFSANCLVNERFRWLAGENVTGQIMTNVSAALTPLDVAS